MSSDSSSNSASSKIIIVRNPRSGAGDRRQLLDQLVSQLGREGFEVSVEESLDNLKRVASKSDFATTTRLVISAGGDGTASAVASRIPAVVPILLFPLGTENLLARWAGSKAKVDEAVSAAKEMNLKVIDAASANGKLSLIMIGVGYDAEVVHQVHSNRKGHITKWTYGWPMFYSAFNYGFPDLRIQATDWKSVEPSSRFPEPKRPSFEVWNERSKSVQGRSSTATHHRFDQPPFSETIRWTAKWLFVANLPNYAGGMSVVPHAQADDGYLCAATFRQGFPIHGLWYVANIYFGSQPRLDDFRSVRAKKYRVECSTPARFQVDGDDGGTLPLEIEVLPQRVTLVLPAKSSKR